MSVDKNVADFESMYDEAERTEAVIPYDIGGPQTAARQLAAYGLLRGEVLDPGTGDGHHAIHYAAHGFTTTGIDSSPTAIERAKRNAEAAGVQVNFQVADALELEGLEGRFDTVVDNSFYHLFNDDESIQVRYAEALHRATTPGARLYMFELSPRNVNGIQWTGVPADNFQRVLDAAGWRLDYLGDTTLEARFLPQTIAAMNAMLAGRESDMIEGMQRLTRQLSVVEPLLVDHRVNLPAWSVIATRLD
jgi:ubiquinone/menaquinone biosynthesis C-methylase UbiE